MSQFDLPSLEEVARAIATVNHSRQTHVAWIKFAEENPDHPENCPDCAAAANAPDHHREVIPKYDQVLGVLSRLSDFIRRRDVA